MILTKEEKAWVKAVNKALAACPSDRLRFFTTGDRSILIADNDTAEAWDSSDGDPLIEAQSHGAIAHETINFPKDVEGVCG